MNRTVILDNEAVRALMSVRHPKHARVVAHAQVVAMRKRKAHTVALVVPTAVRVEAGWDRTAPSAALLNRLRIRDHVLDTATADRAAALADRAHVSVADAHIGATIAAQDTAGPVTVVTSDPSDIRRVADGRRITIATI